MVPGVLTGRSLFTAQVLGRLREFVEGTPGTQVLLVPSGRDAHADPVFPQAAFPASGLPASIRQLPNPATFRLNELIFGVASPDFLKQVGFGRFCSRLQKIMSTCLAPCCFSHASEQGLKSTCLTLAMWHVCLHG